MPYRVVLFIDAQNMYKGAREAFFGRSGPHTLGQFDPLQLGEFICKKQPFGQESSVRQLSQVRVYTGRPESSKDPRTYGAHMRQCAAWENKGVVVRPRTLRYPHDWPAKPTEEKGIDVALAIDFVVMAVEGEYDIGVIASTDTDLRPALEYVINRPGVSAEVVAWHGSVKKGLSIAGQRLWCHRLAKADYDAVADYTDYNLKP